ncbi:MAG: DsbA family protein [Dongiaceae bacterium]
MLLGITMLKIMAQKAVPDTPLKGDYAARDWPRCARLMGIPHVAGANVRLAALPAARAFVWLKLRDPALAERFAQIVYHAHWGEGRDMSASEALAAEGAALGIVPAALIAATQDGSVKQLLRAQVDDSIAKSVLGSPTYIIDGEMFWGADRLDQVDRWLVTGGW